MENRSLRAVHAWYRTNVFRYPQGRTPLSIYNVYLYAIPVSIAMLMAYLVRRPHTHVARILLLPLVLYGTVVTFSLHIQDINYQLYNWGIALVALLFMGHGLEYAFVPKGRFKVGERVLGELHQPAIEQNGHALADEKLGAQTDISAVQRAYQRFVPRGLRDATELLVAVRGIGWDFGTGSGLYVPPLTRPLARKPFLLVAIRSIIINYLVLDALESFIKLVPGVGTRSGGTIFLPSLPPHYRYLVSTAVHFSTGCAFIAGFQMCYNIAAVGGVGIFGHQPSAWPPPFEKPWLSESLHDFWARRWHQFLRQTFLTCGGYPAQYLFGRVGLVIGTFIASGLYHDLAMYTMGNGTDRQVVLFFLAQGVALLLERAWRQATGLRVGGWPGRLWVYFCVIGLGQKCVDSWHRRGLGGGFIIPPVISPTRLLVFPLAMKILNSLPL